MEKLRLKLNNKFRILRLLQTAYKVRLRCGSVNVSILFFKIRFASSLSVPGAKDKTLLMNSDND